MTDLLSRRAGDVTAGVALLAFPFVTAIVKLIAPGWMALIYLMGLMVFVPLYVLVVVIVITGFFARRSPFAFVTGGRLRARTAAWLHIAAFILATAVLVDGGDDGSWTSPLALTLGFPSNSAFADAANVAFVPLTVLSGAALVWLLVEWIVALRARRNL
ncbi:hypothetical protein [uncultured Schumannella sp.]|uniref:hypothetical protein n=1 Tax=uncultured Schumannella sp. TaxID=1195956 RepID=UPI0025DCCD3A|nr:hypothetical protein [uncultured Schumannella sp.]